MSSDAWVEGVSGAIGGCVATVATFPLMTVRAYQGDSSHRATAVSIHLLSSCLQISTRQATRIKASAQQGEDSAATQVPTSGGTFFELQEVSSRATPACRYPC